MGFLGFLKGKMGKKGHFNRAVRVGTRTISK